MYTMESYLVIRKNVLSSYPEKQMELEDSMLREINQNKKGK